MNQSKQILLIGLVATLVIGAIASAENPSAQFVPRIGGKAGQMFGPLWTPNVKLSDGGICFPDSTCQTTAGGGSGGTAGFPPFYAVNSTTFYDIVLDGGYTGIPAAPDQRLRLRTRLSDGGISQASLTLDPNVGTSISLAGRDAGQVTIAGAELLVARPGIVFPTSGVQPAWGVYPRITSEPTGNPGEITFWSNGNFWGSVKSTSGGFIFPDGTTQTTAATGATVKVIFGDEIYSAPLTRSANLSITVAASTYVRFRCDITWAIASGCGAFAAAMNGPASPVRVSYVVEAQGVGNGVQSTAFWSSNASAGSFGSTSTVVPATFFNEYRARISGIAIIGATGGDIGPAFWSGSGACNLNIEAPSQCEYWVN